MSLMIAGMPVAADDGLERGTDDGDDDGLQKSRDGDPEGTTDG
jgi:hypothetical protein